MTHGRQMGMPIRVGLGKSMRGLLVGRNTIAAGVAITAAAGLIAWTPPAHSDVTVTHQEVALTAGAAADLTTVVAKLLAGVSASTVAVLAGGPPLAATAGVLSVVSIVDAVGATIKATGLVDVDPTDWLQTKFLEQVPIDRLIDALPPELKSKGEEIVRVLLVQRLAGLKNLDRALTNLKGQLTPRQKFTDKELDRVEASFTAALSAVGGLAGYQVPAAQVNSWFDQAEARIDRAYDGLEDRLQKLDEQLDKLIKNASTPDKPAAQRAVAKTASSTQSGAAKTPTAARSARQTGKPAAANRGGEATKSPPSHARSQRAAK